MKIILSVVVIFCSVILSAQTLSPLVSFKESPQTHNMHITSDGQYLYTCNGGKPAMGQISKFTIEGVKIVSYKIELDMRSIMYNSSDKKLYVNTYDKKLYRIDDLKLGVYKLVHEFPFTSEQSSPALSSNGKLIYYFDNGQLSVYNMKNGKLKTTLSDLNSSDEPIFGSAAVAVDNKYIYTWNGEKHQVYVYNLKGKFQKTLKLNVGDYGFSLSKAKDLLWVSTDGNYEEGSWYGYVVE